jgi:hypothetical protein
MITDNDGIPVNLAEALGYVWRAYAIRLVITVACGVAGIGIVAAIAAFS